MLKPGQPCPHFCAPTLTRDVFHFDTVAGRHLVLGFYGSSRLPLARAFLDTLWQGADRFDDTHAAFFGVTIDPEDVPGRINHRVPGWRHFRDIDQAVSRAYGVCRGGDDGGIRFAPCAMVIDPRLRVIETIPMTDPVVCARWVLAVLAAQPKFAPPAPAQGHAPVLVLPRVFPPPLCDRLVAYYDNGRPGKSGFMVERDGLTVGCHNPRHKIRRDIGINDPELRHLARQRVAECVIPELHKAFQFRATHIERHIIAGYDGREGGHFSAHRDNTSAGTAHRRFALSVSLTDDYQGGEVMFAEFGRQQFRADRGGAVVFSCALLHQVQPVTSGRRLVYLPFLYDRAAARIREANRDKIRDAPQEPLMAEAV